MAVRFSLGRVVATPGAPQALEATVRTRVDCLNLQPYGALVTSNLLDRNLPETKWTSKRIKEMQML
jgi:hypothetical protein